MDMVILTYEFDFGGIDMYCKKCGKPVDGSFCQNCGTAIEETIPIEKLQPPAPVIVYKSNSTHINGKVAGVIIVIAIVLFVGGMLKSMSKYDSSMPAQAQTEVTTATAMVESKYMTSGFWALNDTNYIFAVEADNQGGDVYQAGTYVFDIAKEKPGKAPIYDIYVRQNGDISKYVLLNDDPDFTVGGNGSISVTQELKKGDYVYVMPYSGLVYEPEGELSIELNK